MKLIKRISVLSLSTLLMFSLVGCGNSEVDNKAIQKDFDKFVENDFIETMESDYLTTHIFMENPDKFGVDKQKIDVNVSEPINDEVEAKNKKEFNQTAKAFEAFDRDDLTKNQQLIFDSCKELIEQGKVTLDDKYKYVGSYFQTISGVHTQFPTLFADLALRNEEDAKNLVSLINSIVPYLDSVLEYTKEQASKGYLMVNINEVVTYCDEIANAGVESTTLTSMLKNIDSIDMSTELKETYKAQVQEAYITSFIPTYQKISTTLNSLRDSKNNKGGLAKLKNGKSYYEVLFTSATGTSKSIKDMKKQLLADGDDALKKVQKYAMKDYDVYEKLMNDEYVTPYTDYDTMMQELEKGMKKDFPKVAPITYNVQPLASDLAVSGIAAYFNLPAIDATTPKQIRVNTNAESLQLNGIDTFTTVAHEGFPGHMYQTSYAYENMKTNWQKVVARNSGYTEGYATYVELYSLKYLTSINEDALELFRYSKIMQNSLIAVVDIMIHYEGASLKDVEKFFTEHGLNSEAASGIYEQIQSNPTVFLPYYVGYSEISRMKVKAQEALGKKFDDKEFHSALLRNGNVSFTIVEQSIDQYIEDNK